VQCLGACLCLYVLIFVAMSPFEASKTKLLRSKQLSICFFSPWDASTAAAIGNLIGQSVGLAGLQGRP
jgi:hypothetical protein